ncbi:hypothetical protein [Streptomyces sp. GS7]|uniref:hypothetical protein n=1 Tax=Streptomyces sp. GS7 TaxID=2692234 RepID=UPI001316CA8B|nr:hypothetical protein [Streptomyces sp. GS7]QHC26115.1 hypothetical protein GR130_36815 [Streptomyces sp. GS7]
MFEVRKSIKRFRDNPAWTYRKRARDYLATCDDHGYPFSLGPDGARIDNLLQGAVQGQEVSLFHLLAWKRAGGPYQPNVAWPYSVAVLPLPRALPATAFTSNRLASSAREEKLPALNPATGPVRNLPDLGTHLVRHVTTDPDFAALINSYALERLMHDAKLGWRIEGNRMIGWTSGRKTYEDLLTMTDTLTTIINGFPEQAWNWPGVM